MSTLDDLRRAAVTLRGQADAGLMEGLADWLESTASRLEGVCDCHWPSYPFDVARLINGGAA